jgi:ABC-type cobalamin transport system ATPase subunit
LKTSVIIHCSFFQLICLESSVDAGLYMHIVGPNKAQDILISSTLNQS